MQDFSDLMGRVAPLRVLYLLVSPRWGDTAGKIWLLRISQKNKNTLTGGSDFFVATPFSDTKSTDLKAKTVTRMECLFLEPLIFGEAKSTDSSAMGFWTDGRTHARTDTITT